MELSMILLIAGGACILIGLIIFILYLTMGKVAGRRLLERVMDEYI